MFKPRHKCPQSILVQVMCSLNLIIQLTLHLNILIININIQVVWPYRACMVLFYLFDHVIKWFHCCFQVKSQGMQVQVSSPHFMTLVHLKSGVYSWCLKQDGSSLIWLFILKKCKLDISKKVDTHQIVRQCIHSQATFTFFYISLKLKLCQF